MSLGNAPYQRSLNKLQSEEYAYTGILWSTLVIIVKKMSELQRKWPWHYTRIFDFR